MAVRLFLEERSAGVVGNDRDALDETLSLEMRRCP
jgi:hypothetical protein